MTAGFNTVRSGALAIVPKITGWGSAFFSLVIIVTVLRDKRKRNKTYHRLLLGISWVDLNSSFWLALSTWPIPSSMPVYAAAGNNRTCKLQGFFTQMGIASSFYNASLSIYFLLVIRYGWKEARLKKIEPYMHAVPLMWGVGTAAASAGLDILGNATLWCWIGPSFDTYRWGFFYGPLWVMIIVVALCSCSIYSFVRQLESTTQRFKYKDHVRSPSQRSSTNTLQAQSSRQQKVSTTVYSEPSITYCARETENEASKTVSEGEGESKTECLDQNQMEEGRTTVPQVEKREFTQTVEIKHSFSRDTSSSNINAAITRETRTTAGPNEILPRRSLLSAISRRLSMQSNRHVERYRIRTREVANQCFWYTGAFFINWTALSVTRILQATNGKVYYPLLLLAVITVPLQGLPNVIVYFGPKYRALRREQPNASIWRICVGVVAQDDAT